LIIFELRSDTVMTRDFPKYRWIFRYQSQFQKTADI
jgi:hypothetical protein